MNGIYGWVNSTQIWVFCVSEFLLISILMGQDKLNLTKEHSCWKVRFWVNLAFILRFSDWYIVPTADTFPPMIYELLIMLH